MKQTARIISTYTGDTSGVCSALFELGGLVVMHDPSGCNSTYSTHDEPRWYDMDSLVFISGLTEKEAIFGNDEKLICDTVSAAEQLKPRFIAVAGTPIPSLTGCDLYSVAFEIENRTGIPTFGFKTDGMKSYVHGASMAFASYTDRMCKISKKTAELSINILGATPLDFSVNGCINSMKNNIENRGIKVNSVIAMGSSFAETDFAGNAYVNLVISSSGLKAAQIMKSKFNIPYIVASPFGELLTEEICNDIQRAAKDNMDIINLKAEDTDELVIIGESVTAMSLARAIYLECNKKAKIISAVDTPQELKSCGCIKATYEDELIPFLKNAKNIIADPLYKPICPEKSNFIEIAHEAFSGRIYRNTIPNLADDIKFVVNKLK